MSVYAEKSSRSNQHSGEFVGVLTDRSMEHDHVDNMSRVIFNDFEKFMHDGENATSTVVGAQVKSYSSQHSQISREGVHNSVVSE